jgi:hypothetical protein
MDNVLPVLNTSQNKHQLNNPDEDAAITLSFQSEFNFERQHILKY